MKFKFIVFIFHSVFLTACSGTKQTVAKEAEPTKGEPKIETSVIGIKESINLNEIPAAMNDSLFDFTVSFWSPGDGIDFTTAKLFLDWLNTYADDGKPQPTFEQVPWGREGEVDFCIKLQAFNKNEKLSFLSEAKSILSQSKKVHFKENAPCRRRRQ